MPCYRQIAVHALTGRRAWWGWRLSRGRRGSCKLQLHSLMRILWHFYKFKLNSPLPTEHLQQQRQINTDHPSWRPCSRSSTKPSKIPADTCAHSFIHPSIHPSIHSKNHQKAAAHAPTERKAWHGRRWRNWRLLRGNCRSKFKFKVCINILHKCATCCIQHTSQEFAS